MPKRPPKKYSGSISVTPQTWALLKAASDETGKTMSELVQDMVDRAIKTEAH